MDFLEYTWATNVVAYDRSHRDNMVLNVENRLTNTAIQTSDWVSRTRDWLNVRENAIRNWLFSADRWYGSYQLLSFLTAFMVLALMVAVGWFVVERWRLRRRALRIGIDTLPSSEQLRLAPARLLRRVAANSRTARNLPFPTPDTARVQRVPELPARRGLRFNPPPYADLLPNSLWRERPSVVASAASGVDHEPP